MNSKADKRWLCYARLVSWPTCLNLVKLSAVSMLISCPSITFSFITYILNSILPTPNFVLVTSHFLLFSIYFLSTDPALLPFPPCSPLDLQPTRLVLAVQLHLRCPFLPVFQCINGTRMDSDAIRKILGVATIDARAAVTAEGALDRDSGVRALIKVGAEG